MPLRQGAALSAKAISASERQPGNVPHIVARQSHAVWHETAAMLIVGALRALPVEQAAGDIGGIDAAGVGVLDLVQAAFAATVAQGFPLAAIKRFERRFPEVWLGGHLTHLA